MFVLHKGGKMKVPTLFRSIPAALDFLSVAALAGAFASILLLTGPTAAQTLEPTRAASITPYGVLGMSQITSAEPVGSGRAMLQFRGNFYKQERAFVGGPVEGARITTASGGLAIGLNDYLDAFGALNIYNLNQAAGGDGSGFGTTVAGAKVSIPFARGAPLRVGGQLAALFGTGNKQINNNELDGYNYLETRTKHDVMATLTQSLLMVREGTGFKVHLNEGVISSFQPGKDIALVTGAGVEVIPIVSLILGLEANSRTFLNDPGPVDPLWVTPSVTWRTPVFVNINAGIDVSLTKEREGNTARALEPWRIFGGVTYAMDTQAAQKREARERARRDSLEKVALGNKARMAQAKTDSTAMAAAEAGARQKAAADSMALKARNDSLALADAAKRLAEERAKRSDMEKQLLTTGLLVMDAVYFETGKTEISINSEPYLTLIAKMLVKYPKLQIEIGGHTDNVGGLEYNTRLSQGRSAAVVAYMLRVAPELGGRLASRGYAYSLPKATNNTAAGRQLNRRTELKVLNRQALDEYR
jgi:outer membrane protein OmpA-like peptidoglycan-associated protein